MVGYDLTDFEWESIKPHLPNKPRGVPQVDDRRGLNGIFWCLRSGAPWADMPARYGPPTTVYNRWRKAGVWDRLMDAITKAYDGHVQMIDTSVVRVPQQGATAKRGVSIDVWVVPEPGSPPGSTLSSMPRADQSSSRSRRARPATSRAPRT